MTESLDLRLVPAAAAAWVGAVRPFAFGPPTFDPVSILTMTLVMVVVMIESTGMFLAVGKMVGKPVSERDLVRGLRGDALGAILGGVFNTFPYTSYSQNVGLVGVTGVRSRFVCVAGGLIMLALALCPKLAALAEAAPAFVLGGADGFAVVFSWMSALAVLGILTVQIMVSLAIIMYFQRNHRGEHGLLSTFVMPAVATVGLIGAFFLVSENLELLTGSDSHIVQAFPVVVLAFGLGGLLLARVIRLCKPDLYENLGRVFD